MRRKTCHDRIEQVEDSYQTAVQTVRLLIRLAEDQPKVLQVGQLSLNQLRSLLKEFDDLYFVRMFACFESDVRHYWQTAVRNTRPVTEQLLSSVAGLRAIPRGILADVQEVREFRNRLIHEQHESRKPEPHESRKRKPLTVEEAKRRLNAFLAWLPLE